MRRELLVLLLSFLAIFLLGSLASFHPADPSVLRSVAVSSVHNWFGLVGAWVAGVLMGCFGIGAFWIPVLVLEATCRIFKKTPHPFGWHLRGMGSLVVILATGAFLSRSTVLGTRFSGTSLFSGGLWDFLYRYANPLGAELVLLFVFLTGFILATGVRLSSLLARLPALWHWIVGAVKRLAKRSKRVGVLKKFFSGKKQKSPLLQDTPGKPDPVIPALSSKGNPRPVREKEGDAAGPTIASKAPAKLKGRPVPCQEEFPVMREIDGFCLPGIDLLNTPQADETHVDEEFLRHQSDILEQKLNDFGVDGKVATVTPGPVITTFEYKPAPGVKISKVTNLADDLALALRALSIRIVAPIPGKAAIGIEVPNDRREMVFFREIVVSETFRNRKSPLTVCLGKDIIGHPVSVEMDKMPHLLIAGATGAGKSVGLNVMITSLLYKSPPEKVKMIMIDPKRIELSVYDGIPHLITPVVTDMKKATAALFWAVKEMERRYTLLADYKCRNIGQFNEKVKALAEKGAEPKGQDAEEEIPAALPYIVIVIDELADLMMVASKEVEVALARLAQMARASGIHIVLATQRPSVDVLTGIIKANFPTRMAFQVSSKTDSRTILDTGGAEALLGSGDMLYVPPGTAKLQRIHGAYISEDELMRVIQFLKDQGAPDYIASVTEVPAGTDAASGADEDGDYDDRYDEAVALVARSGQASISMVQRHLRIGYNRAARIIERMELEGVIGPADGARPREVLVQNMEDMG